MVLYFEELTSNYHTILVKNWKNWSLYYSHYKCDCYLKYSAYGQHRQLRCLIGKVVFSSWGIRFKMQVLLPGRFSFKEFILKEKIQLTSETPADYCPPTWSLSFLSSNQIDVTWKIHCRSKFQQSLPTVSLSCSLHVLCIITITTITEYPAQFSRAFDVHRLPMGHGNLWQLLQGHVLVGYSSPCLDFRVEQDPNLCLFAPSSL